MVRASGPDSEAKSSASVALAWRQILLAALAGTAMAVAFVIGDVRVNEGVAGGVITTDPEGPAAAVVMGDLPEIPAMDGVGHDGPMFYAVARAPMHIDEVSQSLDRPAYRLQRPLYPVLAWALHPSGGGPGLLAAMIVVGVLALFSGGVAAGALSMALRGPYWMAFVFPMLPGATMSLRLSVSDALAAGCVLWAIVLSLRERHLPATVLAVAAVLAKEPVFLLLVGFSIWRRDRPGVLLSAVPAAVAGSLFLYLQVVAPEGIHDQVIEFGLPFRGLWRAADHWLTTTEGVLAAASVLGALGATAWVAFRRGFSHPLTWSLVLSAALLCLLNATVLGLHRNGTRTALPVLAVGLVALFAPGAQDRDDDSMPAEPH